MSKPAASVARTSEHKRSASEREATHVPEHDTSSRGTEERTARKAVGGGTREASGDGEDKLTMHLVSSGTGESSQSGDSPESRPRPAPTPTTTEPTQPTQTTERPDTTDTTDTTEATSTSPEPAPPLLTVTAASTG